MKKILFACALAVTWMADAQNRLSDVGRITIHAVVPESEYLSYEPAKLLETKLSQIITNNGIGDNEQCVRFVLTAKLNVITKDILPGLPQRVSQKIDATLSLGDVVEDKVYSQTTLSLVGVGQSIDKSYIAAINTLNPQNKAIKAFLEEGKLKMLDYYQTHCEDLMAEAQQLSSQQCYEDALFLLSSIPDVCADCFDRASQLVDKVYGEMIEVRGGELYDRAYAAWANNPTREGATEATRLLSQINFAASVQPKAQKLLAEITEKMNEIDRREWEHQMEVYRDNIDREKRRWEQQVREYNDRVETQRIRIQACRDVAMEYARNQPKVVTRVVNYNRVILW